LSISYKQNFGAYIFGEVVMPSSYLVLPYATEESDRKKHFSDNMEVAALLWIAEAERRKKPGLFGGALETLTLLSKLHYPLWVISSGKFSLLLDGMETVSSSILYFKPPDVENFIEHLKRSTPVEELYHSALRSHRETFSEFIFQTEIPIEGFITDKELLSDISAFMKDSKTEMGSSATEFTSLIRSKIDRRNAVRIGKKILEHCKKLKSEMKGLQFAIDTIEEETRMHVSKLQQELEQIREKFERKISDTRIGVMKSRDALEKERREKTERIILANEEETNTGLLERKKWEQKLLRLEQSKSVYEKRKELRRRKNDEVGEARWDARLRDVENQITPLKRKIKARRDFVNRSNKEMEKTIERLNDTYRELIKKEEEKITGLESLRDGEVEKRRKKMEELQRNTLTITNKIARLIEQKRDSSSTLEEATIPWKIELPTLIHVPFYLIRYEAEKKRRYHFRPPIVVRGHKGLVMRIRKTFNRYNTLLKPRSKAIEKMLTSFEKKLKSDKRAQRELNQLGMSHNLLISAGFKEKVRTGMEELEVEGWIKPLEKTAILDMYVTN